MTNVTQIATVATANTMDADKKGRVLAFIESLVKESGKFAYFWTENYMRILWRKDK